MKLRSYSFSLFPVILVGLLICVQSTIALADDINEGSNEYSNSHPASADTLHPSIISDDPEDLENTLAGV